MKNKFNSISKTFSFFLLTAIIISIIIPVIILSTYIVSQIKSETIKQDTIRLNSIAATIGGFFDNAIRLNSLISSNIEVINNLKDSNSDFNIRQKEYNSLYNPASEFYENGGFPLFCNIQTENSFIELLFLQDLNGFQTARSFGLLGNRADRWWFKHFNNIKNEPFFTKSYYSVTGNKPVISIIHPVISDDKLLGCMGMDINFSIIQQFVESYINTQNLYAVILDNEGVIIAHPEKKFINEIYNLQSLYKESIVKTEGGKAIFDLEGFHKTVKHSLEWDNNISFAVKSALKGESGYLENINFNGSDKILYYSPVFFSLQTDNSNNYSVILVRDTSELYLKRNIYVGIIIIFSLLLALLFYYIFKYIFSKKIINPLINLTNYMKLYPNTKPPELNISEKNELYIIFQIFNKMINSINDKTNDLETYKNNLENIVSKRTEQLKKTNIDLKFEIEQKEQAYTEILRLKTAIEQLAVAVIVTSLNGNIIYANSAFKKITGYSPSEVLGEHTRILKSDKHNEEYYKNMWDTITSGYIWEGEIVNKKKTGNLYWEKMIITPVKNDKGENLYFIAIKEDITETKEINDKLKTAMKQAKSSIKAKNSFLANISHEIRTPMNAIVGFANLFFTTKMNDKQTYYITKIKDAAASLMQILDNILYIAKIESGDFKIEPVDFNIDEELENISRKLKQEIKNKDIELVIYRDPIIPTYIKGDSVRLQQAILNLGYNAIKFTQSGNITISVSMLQKTEKKVLLRFSVADTGIGISADKIEQLYNYFSPADDTATKKHSGVGLGLSITKKIINIMKGEIGLKSIPDRGSMFYFSLWFDISDSPKKTNNILFSQNITLSSKKILVVDDNEINREVAVELLTMHKFDVDTASSGFEAIECIKTKKYDAVLMDIYMPEMDGMETTKKIRQNFSIDDLPIIALTASIMPEEISKFKNAGMNDVIIKPISAEHLYEIIGQYIKGIGLSESFRKSNIKLINKIKETPPFLDTETGLKRLSDNSTLYINILKKFYNNHKNDAEKLKQALKNNDNKTIYSIIHTLKGLTGTIGAHNLNNLLKNISKSSKHNYLEKDILNIINELHNFFIKFANLYSIITNNNNDKIISDLSDNELKKYLLQLKEYLTVNDTRSLEIIYFIQHNNISDNFKPLIDKISIYLNQYKMNKALKIVNDLIERI